MAESVAVDPCLDPVEREICEWEYDAGDASTGANPAWVCVLCGKADVNRDPPTHEDDIR